MNDQQKQAFLDYAADKYGIVNPGQKVQNIINEFMMAQNVSEDAIKKAQSNLDKAIEEENNKAPKYYNEARIKRLEREVEKAQADFDKNLAKQEKQIKKLKNL